MTLPNPEDGDPLSDSGQAQRRGLAPLHLADSSEPETPPGVRRNIGPVSASPFVSLARQVVRLGSSSIHLPLPGAGS